MQQAMAKEGLSIASLIQNSKVYKEGYRNLLLGRIWYSSPSLRPGRRNCECRLLRLRPKERACSSYTLMRPHLRPERVLLQHDDARPHTAVITQQAIADLGWELLCHPA